MWIFVGIVLLATQTVANNMTYNEYLESIDKVTITQLPALYGCEHGTRICIWQPGCQCHNDYHHPDNWVVLALDEEAPDFVHKVDHGFIIYCSRDDQGESGTKCKTYDKGKIDNLTKIVLKDPEPGNTVVIENITTAVQDESLEIVDNITIALQHESAKIANLTDNITMAIYMESLEIIKNITKGLKTHSAKIEELTHNVAKKVENESDKIMAHSSTVAEPAEKSELTSTTNYVILLFLGIHCLLALPWQVRSLFDIINLIKRKCRPKNKTSDLSTHISEPKSNAPSHT